MIHETVAELTRRMEEADRRGDPKFKIRVRGKVYELNSVYAGLVGPRCNTCGDLTVYGLGYLHIDCEEIERERSDSYWKIILSQKESIPQELRWDVWERDNFTCKHCGSRKFLTVDHVLAEKKGGTLDMSNLQTLCRSCNSRKGTR